MNALELAEWLEHNAIELPADWTTGEPISNMTKSATMLRKQHAEIERLKALCISYIDDEWSGTSSYQQKIDEVLNG